jgi:hypothetical protein
VETIGPENADLVETADKVQDKERAAKFTAAAKEKTSVTKDRKNPNSASLSVGNDDWPYPVPIVKRNGKWYFDVKAGRKEILNRRIGANEMDAIAICRGYDEVQSNMPSKLMTESISTHNESSARPGSVMGLPGKMRMAVGVVRLERE